DGHSALAVRHVDVFSNSRCCWSGELPRRTPSDYPHSVALVSEAGVVDPYPELLQPAVTDATEPAVPPRAAHEQNRQETHHSDPAQSWMDDINQASRKAPSSLESEMALERPPSGRTRSRRQKAKEMGASTASATAAGAPATDGAPKPRDMSG